jgi:adenylosuccinate lyase
MEHKFIHPIETRYRTDIAKLFTEEKKLEYWIKVEAALAQVHAELGNISQEAADEIETKADLQYVKLKRVKEIDDEIHHDLMAMVKALAEQCNGDAGKYIHLGATSYDIEDTATALQLKEALIFIQNSLLDLLKILIKIADERKNLVCIGRTHGQHAIPTTYGMRFGVWAYEISRHLDRIVETLERISFGKMSGAVGTMASFGENGIKLQEIFLTSLIGQTLAKIARESRILQRNEIAEMFEPFKKKQVGSSTMPHKRNPHKSERICSLARIIKSNVIAAMDNIILEDERDLTNSASERVIIAENFVLLSYIIDQLAENFRNLEFNEQNIEKNLNLTKGACLTEKVMIELVNKGIGRQEGHEMLRKSAIASRTNNQYIKDILMEHELIKSKFTQKEMNEIFDPHKYIGKSIEQVENLIKILENKHNIQ